ncbi:hypothetical protein AMTR_s00015p00025140 [Amborella trichopoda]|uniref:Uncharacterized protein n=1 Tax=Amborella trichopoda TaxID=13333 RepID=W1PMA8_AMBTC|nr:hypothetical protein AMTR_s00015p00025140 [Amborella trichopoda]
MTSNEGDMTMDMDDDSTQDENEAHDDEETDETMENNWREPVIQECKGAQHHAVSNEHEDLMRLAREEVAASRPEKLLDKGETKL